MALFTHSKTDHNERTTTQTARQQVTVATLKAVMDHFGLL
jgi:hypothetical protein